MRPCPCCGFRTLSERGGFELCPVCYWEDDGQDDRDADIARGGPNNLLSLSEARRNFAEIGASDPLWLGEVRPPLPSERPDTSVPVSTPPPVAPRGAMRWLYALADAFYRTFGITEPAAHARRRAAFFILFLLLLVPTVIVLALVTLSSVVRR